MLGGLESIIMIQTWTDKITQSEQVFVFFFNMEIDLKVKLHDEGQSL